MLEDDSLPVILVSAYDEASAEDIISEVIGAEGVDGGGEGGGRVWAVRTKYYRAQLRLAARPDRHIAAPPPVEAHLVYLLAGELLRGPELLRRRAAGLPPPPGPRLLAARASTAPPALAAAARQLGYELVLLEGRAADSDSEEDGAADGRDAAEHGLARLRAALHAHEWPNLTLLPPPPQGGREQSATGGGGSEADCETGWEGEGEEGWESAAEAFAAALRLVSARPHPAAPRAARLAAADRLAAALRAALPACDSDSDTADDAAPPTAARGGTDLPD